ncbi:MAG: hypothetical protein ACE5E0_03070 [Terriglobia bacterium]
MHTLFRVGHALITVLLLVVAAVGFLLFLRILFLFFESLETVVGYQLVLDLTEFCVAPFSGIERVETPYGGFFDLPALVCLIIVVVGESFLATLRSAVGRRAANP